MEEPTLTEETVGTLRTDFIAADSTAQFKVKAAIPVLRSFARDLTGVLAKGWQDMNDFGQPLLRNTLEVREHIARLSSEWKVHAPGVQGLEAYFRSLHPDEPFYFLAERLCDRVLRRDLQLHLRALADGREFATVKAEMMDIFGALLEHYAIGSHGILPELIGERDRSKRICRFCSLGAPHTSFRRKAHAISEFLGNKAVVLRDECDACNTKFGKGIERSLANFVAPFRTFHNVKGKGGLKAMKGRDFVMRHEDGQVLLELHGPAERPAPGAKEYPITLATDDQVAWQDIYRSLCKYFLSVVPDEVVPRFKSTAAWINGNAPSGMLPFVGQAVDYQRFCENAQLTTFLRRSNDRTLPYAIGELRYTCLAFFFIVPFTGEEDIHFNEQGDREHYWSLFKHLHRIPSWSFTDFSDPKSRKVIWNLVARVQTSEDRQ